MPRIGETSTRHPLRQGAATGIPARLASRFRPLSSSARSDLHESLQRHYFADKPPSYMSGAQGRYDIEQHLQGRLEKDRRAVVPWLDSVCHLDGAEILEIGCGTGCSTIALAEQGARVVGIDVDEPSLSVARRRAEVYQLDIEFIATNAVEMVNAVGQRPFDFIVFYASLEHMLHAERIASLRAAWQMLDPGKHLCVVETPNRLWYFDAHTSRLPFYNWLPDDLAFAYAKFSPRDNFREQYGEMTSEAMVHFLRRGRGVSYHEFELAIGPISQWDVVSDLTSFRRRRRWLRRAFWPLTVRGRYERLLHRLNRHVPRGFLRSSLDLVMRK